MTADEQSGLPGADDDFGFGPEESEPTGGEAREGPGADEPETLRVDMGAALDADEEDIAEAAKTSLDMEGFETGAGFDLEDSPVEGSGDIEIEAMEVRSSAFDELDVDESERSSVEGLGDADVVGEGDSGGSAEVDLTIPDLTIPDDVDLTIPDADEASLRLPTPDGKETRPRTRHRGLETLERRRKRRAGARLLMTAASAILIVGGGGFAMAYWGVVEIPGITPPERSRFSVPAPVLPGPQPESPVMSHVIFIDAWREAETPRALADALRERMPDLLGLVAPVLIDGDRQYALVVGPAYGAVEADQLRAPIAIAFDLLNPDPESWTVREASYSFLFGEYETLEEANGRVQALAGLSIPAFVLQVAYSGGASALRVYGVAFSDEVQAVEMRRLLNENGLGDEEAKGRA